MFAFNNNSSRIPASSINHYVHEFVEKLQDITWNQEVFNRELSFFISKLDELITGLNECESIACREHFRTLADPLISQGFLQQYCKLKPYGYAGDFKAIDYILTNYRDNEPASILWDNYFQSREAANAVRNRKDFFKRLVLSYCDKDEVHVLNLGSGPCRDIFEALQAAGQLGTRLIVDCVDADRHAITYGRELLGHCLQGHHVELYQANMFRLHPKKQYDIVWCGGVFDYFSDRAARAMLRKMYLWTNPGGTLSVGNFSLPNPTRAYMEWIVDWILVHRNEEDYVSLLNAAGIKGSISLERELEKVILFCTVRK